MAGRKNFVAGEILTAADVNSFLMDQSVMVFDDSSARGSAIPTPSEGMVTYLKSDDQVTVFDGAAFKPVGGLVTVKHVLKTNTFSASVESGDNVAVTDLSISHAMQDANNKLIISAFFGAASNNVNRADVSLGIHDGTGLIAIGNADGSRSRITAGGFQGGSDGLTIEQPSVTFVHEPGDTSSRTYTARIINTRTSTATLFVNRSNNDPNNVEGVRAVSSLVIQEVAV